MLRIEVLDEDEGHATVCGHEVEKRLKHFEAASRCAEHNQRTLTFKARCLVVLGFGAAFRSSLTFAGHSIQTIGNKRATLIGRGKPRHRASPHFRRKGETF